MNKFQTSILSLTPAQFQPHAVLHNHEQNFRETNCYADLVIEIINNLGLNPIACLGYAMTSDFEGDQWTFGKPGDHDLQTLYGIQVEELSLYGSLLKQLMTQVDRGALPLIEVDSFYLPDTKGIDYRESHVKTTIGITHIDVENKVLHYFHNATFAKLDGEDFDGIFTPPIAQQHGYLPPYCEIAKLNNAFLLDEATLKNQALALAKQHFLKRPAKNPFTAFAQAADNHQKMIIDQGEAAYHAYTFVAPRQLGASHQLGGHFLTWLSEDDADHLASAAQSFYEISNTAKSLVLKLARLSFTQKPVKLDSMIEKMADQWEIGNTHLTSALTK